MLRASVCAFVLIAGATAGMAALAAASGGNTDVVLDTVYDGGYVGSQSPWANIPVQFIVSSAGQIALAGDVAFCGPPGAVTLTRTKVTNDAFTSVTSHPSANWRVTITGHFRPNGRAVGTSELVTENILGQPCTEVGTWGADALPKGTKLCPDVDGGNPVDTSVTGMTCAQAASAYDAGLRYMKTHPSSDVNAPFQTPGFTCVSLVHDDVVSSLCTRGKMSFRLPE